MKSVDYKYIVIACDCDPDRLQYGGYSYGEKRLVWNGLKKGIPIIIEEISRLEDLYKLRIPFTWNIRSDEQIKEVHGDANWVIEQYYKIWEFLKQRGDSLCWHPHLWKWDDYNVCWYQELKSKDWIENCLYTGFSSFNNVVGSLVNINQVFTQAGWCFQNNLTMKIFDNLSVNADYSALPGMISYGYSDNKAFFANYYDWQITSHKPYFTSTIDYRRGSIGNEKTLGLLEIPKYTFKNIPLSFGISLIKDSRNIIKHMDIRLKEYMKLNPTLSPIIFKTLISAFNKSQEKYLIIYFHADEILNRSHNIRSLENLINNIKILKNTIHNGLFISFNNLYIDIIKGY